MANPDEPTEELKDPVEYETKPIMDLILKRVKALSDELTALRDDMTARLEAAEKELRDLKKAGRKDRRQIH